MAALAASPRRIIQDFGLDPITFSPITDPVIDECGHTFDKATIAMLTAGKPVGTPIICPFSRQVIDTNKLVVNLFAREAVDHVNHLESRLEHLANQIQEASIRQEQSNKKFEMIFEQLLAEKEVATKSRDKTEQAFLECHQRLNFLEAENKKLEQKNEDLLIEKKHIAEENKKHIAEENKKHIAEVSDLKKNAQQFNNDLKAIRHDLQLSKQRSSRTKRQLQNVDSMSVLDRVLVVLDPITGAVIGYKHLDSIKNRGLLTHKG